MKKTDKIFVAGHNGLVGSSVVKILKKNGYKNLFLVNRKNLDLRDYKKVKKFFKRKKINYLVMAAAKAGGIIANSKNQKDFFLENIEIQNSLLKLAYEKKIKRTIFLGTSCIYPKFSKVPIKESSLLSGQLEKTNQCYAIAKIAGIKLCEALYEDHNLDLICLMPTNVYGEKDKFDKEKSHVIPGIIVKIEEAIKFKKNEVKLFGTGKPLREFIHADDLGNAIFKSLKISKKDIFKNFKNKLPIINIGTNEEVSIKKLSQMISSIYNYNGKITFDPRFPDGTFRKKLNSNIIRKYGWLPKITLLQGLESLIKIRRQKL